ncbi:glycosyl hydrolase family 28-related protein [Ruania alkalisoli]|uniref:glycosyl hydrolase family 28-related protein n=1 Tax=Ruania alkalisoli TaxID=2779775 RepID=UPI001B35505B|nr:glycosyl hydrolase family 28-related protein [Ruania alkalisoli]
MTSTRETADDTVHVSRGRFLSTLGLGSAAVAAMTVAAATPAHADTATTSASTTRFDVRNYGAVGDGLEDDSAAFQQVLDEIVAAGAGTLYVPAGDYRLASRVTYDWNTNEQKNIQISILGDGQGVSNLHADNTDGVLQLITGRASHITIANISFWADLPGAGTAIYVERPRGGLSTRTLTALNFEMRGTGREDYFDYGIQSINQGYPFFSDVIFRGIGNRSTADNSPRYAATCAFHMDGSYSPMLQNCYAWSAATGFQIVPEGEGMKPEDGTFYNCFAVGVRVGIDVRTAPGLEPALAIDRCHINARDVGARIRRMQFSVTNSLFYNSHPGDTYNPDTAPEYVDILIENGWVGLISHNMFHQPFNKNRTAIVFEAGDNPATGATANMLVKNNFFTFPGTGISVAEGVTGVAVEGNSFDTGSDPFTGIDLISPMIDDHSGSVAFASDHHRGALASKSAAQTIENSTWTSVSWDSAEYDTGGFREGAEPGEFVVPTGAGVRFVRLNASIAWAKSGVGWRQVQLFKNGDPVIGGLISEYNGVAGVPVDVQNVTCLATPVIPVTGGDVLTVSVRHTSGGPLEVDASPSTAFAVEVVDG